MIVLLFFMGIGRGIYCNDCFVILYGYSLGEGKYTAMIALLFFMGIVLVRGNILQLLLCYSLWV